MLILFLPGVNTDTTASMKFHVRAKHVEQSQLLPLTLPCTVSNNFFETYLYLILHELTTARSFLYHIYAVRQLFQHLLIVRRDIIIRYHPHQQSLQ